MSQANQLLDLVKQALKDQGKTYADLARGLRVSESSVKRLFSKRRLTLERLEQVCAHLGLELTDLLDLARASQSRITELSEEQEKAIVADHRLLLVALLTLGHWSAEEMVAIYRFTAAEVVKHLTRLDSLGIIDLMPGNRVKLRIARNFSWRRGGPLQRFFESRAQKEYFDSAFQGAGELRLVVNGSLSSHSNALLQQRMRKLAEEFDGLAEDDRALDHRTLEGTTLVVAIRPWELKVFTALRR